MAQKLRKAHLRKCAPVALGRHGFTTRPKTGPGIMPNARLWASNGAREYEVAVRTSLDREVGLTRHPSGEWALPEVHRIVVSVPATDDAGSADVYMFDPDVLTAWFDIALADLEKRNSRPSYKSPIFVPLDDRRKRSEIIPGLKAKAEWHEIVPLTSMSAPGDSTESVTDFASRVKREFADQFRADINKVFVDIRIAG